MKIVKLQTENILGIKAFIYSPTESVIVIGGENGAGKTSVLDSIEMALAERDKRKRPEAVRIGAKKGRVVADLGDLIITRTFTAAGGGTLSVERADGSPIKESPQAVLNALYGKISFDPSEFERMDPAKQVETLKKIVGLDFTEMDAERARAYQERTLVGRDLLSARTRLDAMPVIANPPAEEVDTRELAARLTEVSGKAARAQGLEAERSKWVDRNAEIVQQLERLRYELEQGEAKVEELTSKLQEVSGAGEEIKVITEQMAGAQEANAKVKGAAERAKLEAEVADLEATHKVLTDQIEMVDDNKRARLAAAQFPVPGLGFDENGVTYNGVPFTQVNAAQRLRVSVAIGMSLNPKVKVILIRDASLLTEKSTAVVAEMAEANGYQVWMEKATGDPRGCSVFIEEGEIKTVEEWNAEQAAVAAEADEDDEIGEDEDL